MCDRDNYVWTKGNHALSLELGLLQKGQYSSERTGL